MCGGCEAEPDPCYQETAPSCRVHTATVQITPAVWQWKNRIQHRLEFTQPVHWQPGEEEITALRSVSLISVHKHNRFSPMPSNFLLHRRGKKSFRLAGSRWVFPVDCWQAANLKEKQIMSHHSARWQLNLSAWCQITWRCQGGKETQTSNTVLTGGSGKEQKDLDVLILWCWPLLAKDPLHEGFRTPTCFYFTGR